MQAQLTTTLNNYRDNWDDSVYGVFDSQDRGV